MTVVRVRPSVTAELVGGPAGLAVAGGTLTLDALGIPYGSAILELPDPQLEDELDPRASVRVKITAADAIAGTTRTFNLGVRERTLSVDGGSLSVVLATDEALLEDYATLVKDTTPATFQSSLRAIVNYVLGKIGAALQPGGPDIPFNVLTTATNLILNPRVPNLTTYQPVGCNAILDTSFPGTRPNGIAQNGVHLAFPNSTDSYVALYDLSANHPGLVAGKSYILSASGSVRGVLGGDALGRARRLCAFVSSNGAAHVETKSAAIPNVAEVGGLAQNTEHRVSVRFTIPAGTFNVLLRAYLGWTTGSITWTKFSLVEENATAGVDNAEYFTGADPDTSAYDYAWTAAVDASSSKRTALQTRPPELLHWEPGTTAWDFLAPLCSSAGLRLFCDELRAWRLIDPKTYYVPGLISLSGHNITDGSDTISRNDAEVFATGVVVRYRYNTGAGATVTVYDTAGTPEKVFVVDYETPYPGPGAAAAILARRNGTGRTQEVSAVVAWPTTPGMEASVNLPGAPLQRGKLTVVTFPLNDDPLMSVGTRGLIDIIPGTIDALVGTIDALVGTIDALK